MKLLALIPAKIFAKYLPKIIAFSITKGLGYLKKKYPNKFQKAKETVKEIMKALSYSVEAAEDGVVTEQELTKAIELWDKVRD